MVEGALADYAKSCMAEGQRKMREEIDRFVPEDLRAEIMEKVARENDLTLRSILGFAKQAEKDRPKGAEGVYLALGRAIARQVEAARARAAEGVVLVGLPLSTADRARMREEVVGFLSHLADQIEADAQIICREAAEVAAGPIRADQIAKDFAMFGTMKAEIAHTFEGILIEQLQRAEAEAKDAVADWGLALPAGDRGLLADAFGRVVRGVSARLTNLLPTLFSAGAETARVMEERQRLGATERRIVELLRGGPLDWSQISTRLNSQRAEWGDVNPDTLNMILARLENWGIVRRVVGTGAGPARYHLSDNMRTDKPAKGVNEHATTWGLAAGDLGSRTVTLPSRLLGEATAMYLRHATAAFVFQELADFAGTTAAESEIAAGLLGEARRLMRGEEEGWQKAAVALATALVLRPGPDPGMGG